MWWITCRRNQSIPNELKYSGWQTDKDEYQHTPLMLWIKQRDGEPIPNCLYYKDW